MACRQILPGRRWCRLRPFLVVLVLAACLFYQTLTPLRTRRYISPVGNGVLPDKVVSELVQHRRYKEISARQARCFLPSSNLQVWKELQYSNDLRNSVRNFMELRHTNQMIGLFFQVTSKVN